MKENRIEKIEVIILFLLCAWAITGHAAETKQNYMIVFPSIDLSRHNNEGIEEVYISVACGHITDITNIPNDWNIEVIRAVSAVEQFHASAGHGASRLPGTDYFNGKCLCT